MLENHIVVAGNVLVDLLIFSPPKTGSKQCHDQTLSVRRCLGGSVLVAELLHAAVEKHKNRIHKPFYVIPEIDCLEHFTSAITELEVFGAAAEAPFGFKVKRRQQLHGQPRWHSPRPHPAMSDNLTVLLLQDAELRFSEPNDAVDLFRKSRPRVLLYAMARPSGVGDIWDAVRRGPYGKDGKQDPEKLVVVVSADDLRAVGIELSHGLSWEKTCEDFVENLGSNGKLDTLVTCANLIILFGCDGVIYHRGRQMVQPTLFFDPLCVEGDFCRRNIGYLPGLTEAFLAGLATEIAVNPDDGLENGIKLGLRAARRMAKLGFRQRKLDDWPSYPVSEVMQQLFPDERLITLSIPSESIVRGNTGDWSILRRNIGDPVEVAHQIVKEGPFSAASRMPLAQFGRLIVLDRQEIEAFRTLFNSIKEYLAIPQTKPLNIAIFGSRGSGKSYGATQVAAAAATAAPIGREVRQLRFNLSQFTRLEDLLVAFNTIRDSILSGFLPLVYINGFDTEYSGLPLGWLQYLSGPLHGGQFLDRGEMRHIGPAILLLGSSTKTSCGEFLKELERAKDVPSRAAQEFSSCLHGFVDMLGIDRVSCSDTSYTVRRAVVLRALLVEREPNLQIGEGISIDESVLDGLLMVPTFRHGLRSLKSIIAMSKVTNRRHFERAALPPKAQLSLHLDYADFMGCLHCYTLPEQARETIAEGIHGNYVEQMKAMANKSELQDLENKPSMRPWTSLDEEFKESSRAQAADIPRKLRMIGCFITEMEENRDPVENFTKSEVDCLGECEHERFNAERLQNQWRLGERDETGRKNPFLVPWRDLEVKWQNVDREMVKRYPEFLPKNLKNYRIGEMTKKNTPTLTF